MPSVLARSAEAALGSLADDEARSGLQVRGIENEIGKLISQLNIAWTRYQSSTQQSVFAEKVAYDVQSVEEPNAELVAPEPNAVWTSCQSPMQQISACE